jgi:hypothetical protein
LETIDKIEAIDTSRHRKEKQKTKKTRWLPSVSGLKIKTQQFWYIHANNTFQNLLKINY